jgi:hypothetical protein
MQRSMIDGTQISPTHSQSHLRRGLFCRLLFKAREAIFKRLAVLVRSVFGKAGEIISAVGRVDFCEGDKRRRHIRRSTGRLQKGGFADIALDIFGLLVDLQLRLGCFGIFVFAIPLRGGLGSLR